MITSKHPLKVFLCHTSADKPAIRRLYNRLSAEGWIDPWLDKEKILPGQDWDYEIRKAVRDADVIAVCISRRSITKEGYVQREIKIALDIADEKPEGTIYIVPIRLEECDPPERLQRWQWVDLYLAKGYELLLASLQRRAKALELEPVAYKKSMFESLFLFLGERRQTVFSLLAILIALLIFLFGNNIYGRLTRQPPFVTASAPVATETISALLSLTPQPITASRTIMPSQVLTETFTPVTTSSPTKVVDKEGVEVVLIPAGEFVMGSSPEMQREMLALCQNCDPDSVTDQSPQRSIYLDDFWIDKTEVTIAQFREFVEQENYLTAAERKGSSLLLNRTTKKFTTTQGVNWRKPNGKFIDLDQYGNYPVTHVNWNDARAYCNWRGGYLPTEAQWEKAARWEDGRFFPWGNTTPNNTYLNFDFQNNGPVAVMSYPAGVSKYGVYDMAGNVWEWVNDWYADKYIQSETINPNGASSGPGHLFRGGSWASELKIEAVNVMTTYRAYNIASWTSPLVGFRCVRSTP